MRADKRVSHFDTLESVLDQTDLKQLLLMLARICNEKAERVGSHWEDGQMAKDWEFNANKLAVVAEKVRRR